MRLVAYLLYRLALEQSRRLQRNIKTRGKIVFMLQKVAPPVNGENDTSWYVCGAVGETWHVCKKYYVVDKRCVQF